MKNLTVLLIMLLLVTGFSFNTVVNAGDDHSHGSHAPDSDGNMYGEMLGDVAIPVSCNEEAQGYFKTGLALLHHMTYEGANSAFVQAAEADPDCAMAYWGQAMTFIHPLWSDPPGVEKFGKGLELVQKAKGMEIITALEKAFINAVSEYYEAGYSKDEKRNLKAFEKGWKEAYEKFPGEPDAASFYALAHMANADPSDKSYERQKRSGEIAITVLEKFPDHPGAHHYAIHAYDYPELAENAVKVANGYGEIAPDVPHSLHMPSHIFTRTGMWDQSIEWNMKSAGAALKHPAGGSTSLHYLHALDYLEYAYLQKGDDEKAKQVMNKVAELEGPVQVHLASAYAFAAVPARYYLERQEWEKALSLDPRIPGYFSWDMFPAVEAITYFAHGIGAARSSNPEAAGDVVEKMESLRVKTAESSPYWAKQVEIQKLSAGAWLMYSKGEKEQALSIMNEAAELESTTEKHPVNPGEIIPARELLGDMLMEMGKYDEARKEYEAVLERSANRFNSLYGAGRASELAGDKTAAAEYYQKLLDMSKGSSMERPALKHANAFLAE